MSHASLVGSPALWLLPGLLRTEPTPDHSDKDTLVPGLKEEEEGKEKGSPQCLFRSELLKHTDPQLDRQESLQFLLHHSVPVEVLLLYFYS